MTTASIAVRPQIGGQCVDADASEAAVADYEKAGVDTFVVGMPGSEAYRSMLNRLAIAGNTARPGNTAYYAVSDTDELSVALRSIGAQVAISCDLPLSETPENPELVNVYFDDQVVPKSDDDGWRYDGENKIQFVGATCDHAERRGRAERPGLVGLPDRSSLTLASSLALTGTPSDVTVRGVKPAPELEALRRSIDELDGRILQLVADRVKVVLAVGQFKRENNIAVYDPERERKMLERLCSQAPEPLDADTVRRIFERLIDESRRIEQHSMGKHG